LIEGARKLLSKTGYSPQNMALRLPRPLRCKDKNRIRVWIYILLGYPEIGAEVERPLMKTLALRLMRDCGAFALARSMSAGMARILMYHNFCADGETSTDAVNVTAARKQLAYLRRHFRVVPFSQALEELKLGGPSERLTVALTIDDGRRNCYEFLFPLLVEFDMPATFFVVSSFIRGEDWLWTDKVLWLSEQPSRPPELSPGRIENFFETLNRVSPATRNEQIADMATRMEVFIPKDAPAKYAPCSWNELRDMADSGLVEIGSHTISHPILASIPDEESWRELTLSRAQIEENMGRPVRSFCFPNGKPGDYRPSQVQQIIDAGYTNAVVARRGMVAPGASFYELPRIGVSGLTDELHFSKDLDGVDYFQLKLQGALGLTPAP
jgi:peptidoglycan/xylan/chitin deacetylase (PgdA/CDA1 family)